MNNETDVKDYLKRSAEGMPEADRPRRCEHCSSERLPHRHGTFLRWVFTVGEALRLPVHRFLCPDCRKTMSLLPVFVEPHHQSAVDVKEAVVRDAAEGCSLPEIVEASGAYAGGGYSEKTIRRWRQTWNRRRDTHEERIWAVLFHHGLDAELPRKRSGGWPSLFAAWNAHPGTGSLFACLLQLDRPSVAAAG